MAPANASVISSIAYTFTNYIANPSLWTIQDTVFFACLKLMVGFLISFGVSATQKKEIKTLILIVSILFGLWAVTDFLRIAVAVITQTMP